MPPRLIPTPSGTPVKAWMEGVPFDSSTEKQLRNTAGLPIIFRWIAAMPDAHTGKGATIGSVIPTLKAVIPAAVGVDIGCGMMAVQTSLKGKDLPDDLKPLRSAIEQAVPHGRTHGGNKCYDRGAWSAVPDAVADRWRLLQQGFEKIKARHPAVGSANTVHHLGTLGTGNHFIEVCLDETQHVWVMLHSGSRGIGNRIGTYFIDLAKKDMGTLLGTLPDKDLAYLKEGTLHFGDYLEAVSWAQEFASVNRELMMEQILAALRTQPSLPPFRSSVQAVNCHHNYVRRETHFGSQVWVTRKGAVSARSGELGIIPGSMGAKSFIVCGLGNPESFHSCSHGAGRTMSRTEARKRFTVSDHLEATRGVECRKDKDVLDETPGAYKPIDAVMQAQSDLVSIRHTLKQVLCVKG